MKAEAPSRHQSIAREQRQDADEMRTRSGTAIRHGFACAHAYDASAARTTNQKSSGAPCDRNLQPDQSSRSPAGLCQPGAGEGAARPCRHLARCVGHSACPRRHLSGCVCRARVCTGAGPALADGGAAAAWHRPLCRMARRPRCCRRHDCPADEWRRRLAPRLRPARRRGQGDAGGVRARRQCVHRAAPMAGRVQDPRLRTAGVGALAFHRCHAADRIPDGIGVVEALARRGAADRRRRQHRQAAFR